MSERKMYSITNSNVMVIGGAGFLGSHLVKYLTEIRGCRVTVIDNLISGKLKHIKGTHESVYTLDITEMSELDWNHLFEKHEIEYVFNYAAEPYIPECFERPMHFFRVNALAVLTLLNALNAVERSDVKGVLQVSSAELYGSAKGKVDENHPIEPHSTYGVAKAAADGLVQVRWREGKVPAIALRQFNCVGERETHEYVIPEIISQLHHSGGEVNLGNNSMRDFLYAGDAVRMATELLEVGDFGEVYNLGSETCISIYSLAELIGRVMGVGPISINVDQSRCRPWEIWHLQSDNSKIYSKIMSRPQVDLEEALYRTVRYFRANDNKWDW